MSTEILTLYKNPRDLRKKSYPVELPPNLKHLTDLLSAFHENALGLAAPQIGIHERIFAARLSSGKYVFINPQIKSKSNATFPSTEACLSLPNIERTVERHLSVTLEAEMVHRFDKDDNCEEISNFSLNLVGLDAAIVQHENDHLDGVLIIDLPEVPKQNEDVQQKAEKRKNRIKEKRAKKEAKKRDGSVTKMNPKRASKINKLHKRYEKKQRQIARLQEERRADEQGITDQSAVQDSDSN